MLNGNPNRPQNVLPELPRIAPMPSTRATTTTRSSASELTPLDASKLTPPRSNSRVVPRERLLEKLQEARRKRCIVLRGQAGCGKTTTLVAWRQALLSLGFDVAWLSLAGDDNDLQRFLDYLLASLAQVDARIVEETRVLEAHGSDGDAVERSIITLVRGIARHPRDLVLILDDLHCLTDVRIHQALQWLLDYAPANLHLVLASRSALPLSLGRLRSQGQTLELDLADLRFTLEETERFLAAQLGQVSPRDSRLIFEQTDGWIAGLQLLAASRRKARQGDETWQASLRDNQAFADFFRSEVLAPLSPTDLDLLLHMAVCERFCASLCAALIGRPEVVAEATVLLARLESDNLFINAIDNPGAEPWYRLHPLLRETLLKEFQRLDEAQRRQVHKRAWGWLREQGQLVEAVRHAVQGDEAAAAAQLVEERLEALYAQGDLRMLVELARLLPAEQIAQRVRLRLLLARMQVFSRDFAACRQTIEQLQHDIPAEDSDALFRLAMLRAVLAVQRDDTEQAMEVLPQLLAPPPTVNAVMIGGSLNILSWLYMHRGEYERARQIQLDRPPLLVDGVPLLGTAGGSLQGRALIGLSLAMEGHITQAERIYREVIYEAQRVGRAATDAQHLATALLGETLYEANEIDAARTLLEDQVDAFERISIPDSVLRVLEVLGKCHWQSGNQREAFAYMERLEEYGRKLNLDRLQAHALAWQVQWHLTLGELVAAETSLARLDALDARHGAAAAGAMRDIPLIVDNAHVRWEATHGDLQAASLRLNRMLGLCETGGRQLGITRLKTLAAVIDARRGQFDSAREKLLAALRTAQRYGLLRSVLDAAPGVIELVDRLSYGQALDPLLSFYIERLREAEESLQQLPPASDASAASAGWKLAPGMEPLSERELEVLRLLAQALPNKKIARALGLSHETVKWHLRHIYSKLGVSSRDEAVARMRDAEADGAL